MEQTPRAFFQTTFESIGRVCAARHARGGLGLISSRLKNKKQPAQPVFLAKPLIPTATPSSLLWERVRERATSRKACIWAVGVFRKIAEIRGMPSPQPSPTGEGAGGSRFCEFWRFEKQLVFTTVDTGRLKSKKQPAQPVFLAEPLIPTAAPSSLPVGES